MIKAINERGFPVYSGATTDTHFDASLFQDVDTGPLADENQHWALHTNLGSLTVLDRMTGFGYRDVETGFRDKDGKFWLASGNYDVRHSGSKTLGDAIEWIKRNANTCVGD